MTRRLIAALAVEALLVALIGLTALDMRAHARVEHLGGVNVWGYRGRLMNAKRANETRLAVVGGDLAFGWGVAPTETLAPYLGRLVSLEVDRPGSAVRLVTTVTAGAMGLAPRAYAGWLAHLAFLHPDVVCLVLDPPDHAPSHNDYLPDRGSLVFRTFGYSPILPLVLQEKAALTGSRSLRVIGVTLAAIDDRLADRPSTEDLAASPAELVSAVDDAVRAGLQVASTGVVVVVPAPVGAGADGSALATELLSRFDREPRVRVVDLGGDARLHDPALRLDGFHFSSAGHSRAAELVSPRVLDLIRAERVSR